MNEKPINPKMRSIPRWKGYPHLVRPENKALIEELHKVRKRVQRARADWTNGICAHLSANTAGIYLGRYIMNQLTSGIPSYAYLAGWISNQAKFSKWDNAKGYKQARLMWIDWMIASLENKEYQP